MSDPHEFNDDYYHGGGGRYPWEQPTRIDNNTKQRNAQTPEERKSKLYEEFRKAKGKPSVNLLFEAVRESFREAPEDARDLATNPIGPVPEGHDVLDLAAWTVVGNVLLNLDEMFMKR